jgi:hypothetical protein
MYKLKFVGFFIFLVMFFTTSCNLLKTSKSEKAIYIIPENYVGSVIIVFEQSNGINLETENGANVYRVPSNGIIKVTCKAIYASVQETYFYEDFNGNRKEIDYLYPTSEKWALSKEKKTFDQIREDDSTTFIIGSEMGTFNNNDGVIHFRNFKVGKASDSSKLNQEAYSKVTKIQEGLLQD